MSKQNNKNEAWASLAAAVGIIIIIVIILWVFWIVGNVMFHKAININPIDRLGATIICAAVLHASMTNAKRK